MTINKIQQPTANENLARYQQIYNEAQNLVDNCKALSNTGLYEHLTSMRIDLAYGNVTAQDVALLYDIYQRLIILKELLAQLESEHRMILAIIAAIHALISMIFAKVAINPLKEVKFEEGEQHAQEVEEQESTDEDIKKLFELLRKNKFITYEENENDISNSVITLDIKRVNEFIEKHQHAK